MKTMKLKVCGMKYKDNIEALLQLQPDFIGFIFYPNSKRFVNEELNETNIHNIPASITKVGVFVNETKDNIISICKKYRIETIQLHGEENQDFCKTLKETGLSVIKAFSIGETFNFDTLANYNTSCNFFLFDTKGDNYGGTGIKFDWEVLKGKEIKLPYFLSGGIDLTDATSILNSDFLNIFSIDINSKFELAPGVKDIEKIKQFKLLLQ